MHENCSSILKICSRFANDLRRLGHRSARLLSSSTKPPSDLIGHVDLDTKFIRPGEDQAGVLLKRAAHDYEIQVVLFEEVVGQLRVVDGADGADGQVVADSFFDLDSEGGLVCWLGVRVLLRVVASA